MQFTILQSVYKNDKPEYLNQCLESIKNNTLQPTKIVLVKDGEISDDWKGKFDFLKEKCEVVYLERTPEISTTQIKMEIEYGNNKLEKSTT